jgi:Mn-dependent DtxR family transcriptional regulator
VSFDERRSPKTVRNSIRSLWGDKLIEGSNSEGYKLTQIGHSEAEKILARCLAESS